MSINWQARILLARNDLQQLLDPFAPLRLRHNAELRQMRPQTDPDYLESAAHAVKVAHPMQHQPGHQLVISLREPLIERCTASR